jgi:hypothetical protein
MARQDLSGLTPAEVKAHKNKQAKDRMAKMRAAKKEERKMAKKKALLTPTSPEVVEFLAMTKGHKIAALTEAVAIWEREYKQAFPLAPLSDDVSPYGPEGMHRRDLGIAVMLADAFFEREKAAARKKKFDAEQAREADRQGITVFELQKRRKIAASVKAKKEREVQRLADKVAA